MSDSVIDMRQFARSAGANLTFPVGSVVFNWNELGYQESAGKLLDGKSHVLGIKENGITVVKNNLLSAAGKAAVDKAVDGLKAGSLGVAP